MPLWELECAFEFKFCGILLLTNQDKRGTVALNTRILKFQQSCMNVFANVLFWLVPMSANLKKSIRGVIFDLDGTLLDTKSLADTAILDTFGSSFDKSRMREILEEPNKLQWNLKKNILGLRGDSILKALVRITQKTLTQNQAANGI